MAAEQACLAAEEAKPFSNASCFSVGSVYAPSNKMCWRKSSMGPADNNAYKYTYTLTMKMMCDLLLYPSRGGDFISCWYIWCADSELPPVNI